MEIQNPITIVFKEPRFPENIGAAARAMHNMGFSRLVVVNPEKWDLKRINMMATHEAAKIVEQIRRVETLTEAVATANYVVGTTARLGRQRPVIQSPAALANHLSPLSTHNEIALVFGPEDRGLTNEDLRLCHKLVTIPTADFASINLAQSVMIFCYELSKKERSETAAHMPRLANRHELDGMYTTLKETLLKIDYIKPDNPDYWMNKIRTFGTHMKLRAREVSIIRGICRQIDWYGDDRYAAGRTHSKRSKDE